MAPIGAKETPLLLQRPCDDGKTQTVPFAKSAAVCYTVVCFCADEHSCGVIHHLIWEWARVVTAGWLHPGGPIHNLFGSFSNTFARRLILARLVGCDNCAGQPHDPRLTVCLAGFMPGQRSTI
jgi:hypothetical protein